MADKPLSFGFVRVALWIVLIMCATTVCRIPDARYFGDNVARQRGQDGTKQMIGVSVGVGPIMTLHSGATLDLLDPGSSNFTIEDIAHGLAHICRYAGQCREFYSVAEHSIFVSETVREFGLEALLHDAAEAFIGDVIRPLKQLLPEYKRIEDKLQGVIRDRYGLPQTPSPQVKEADLRVLSAEQAQIMPAGLSDWAIAEGIAHAPIRVRYLKPNEAKRQFLERYVSLQSARELAS